MKNMKQIMRRLVSAGGADDFLQQNLSTFGYLCVCLNAIFFGYILVTEPVILQSIFFDLTTEDSYVENLTAILFFLAGLLLVIVATTERRIFPRCIYILGCVAFIFVTGEEISWGQRIFGFDTPENLMNINLQNEFTIHNIKIGKHYLVSVFGRIHQYGTFVFCIITFVAFSFNKKTIFGIPLPSIPLMLGFLVMLSSTFGNYHLIMEDELLLIFIIYTLLSKQIYLILYATATMILITVVPYTYRHDDGIIYSVEIQEFLLGLCCFFYSLELLYAQRSANLFSVKDSLKTMFSHISWICVMYGSIYLVFLKLSQPEMILHDQRETIRFLKKTDPIIHSNYDVYLKEKSLKEKSLVYVKDNCSSEDMNMMFFLHVYPIQQSDLPYSRKQFGFDLFDFYSEVGDLYSDGQRCIVVRHLPSYDIAKITTGQFIVNRRNGKVTYTPIWNETFTLTREAGEPNGE